MTCIINKVRLKNSFLTGFIQNTVMLPDSCTMRKIFMNKKMSEKYFFFVFFSSILLLKLQQAGMMKKCKYFREHFCFYSAEGHIVQEVR